MSKKIYIIGGGPSGMNAAITAQTFYPETQVYLLDSQERLGKKLQQTGGGRCNITANVSPQDLVDHIPKNGKFLFSSFHSFGSKEIIQFFEENNCPLKEEDHARMFPASNKSVDIIETLQSKLIALGVKIYYNCEVSDILPLEQKIITKNQVFTYDALILATGGKTLPQTGSNGSGYILAEKAGHTITPLLPAEVPLVSNDAIIQSKKLQGLSFHDVSITVYKKNKRMKVITHDLLFTHFGLSGPAALRASFYVIPLLEKKLSPVLVTIDFLPDVSYETLEKKLSKTTQTERQTLLMTLGLQKRFIQALEEISDNNQTLLIQQIKKFPLHISDTRGIKQAFVTNGGVNIKEIDPQTMQSKITPHISFCGELMDINAYTGGYNISAALSSGYTAGKYALQPRLIK